LEASPKAQASGGEQSHLIKIRLLAQDMNSETIDKVVSGSIEILALTKQRIIPPL
jgi:hypothetical protein